MKNPESAVVVEEVTDPEELAAAQIQDERFERNVSWLREHAGEVYSHHRGKFICIAGGELFVADTAEEALAQARKAHPEDNGRYLRYIPLEKVARVYVHFPASGTSVTMAPNVRSSGERFWHRPAPGRRLCSSSILARIERFSVPRF